MWRWLYFLLNRKEKKLDRELGERRTKNEGSTTKNIKQKKKRRKTESLYEK